MRWGCRRPETTERGVVIKYVYSQGTPDEVYGQPNVVFCSGLCLGCGAC